MDTAKKTVAIGAASGIAAMAALVTILSWAIPAPAAMATVPERLALALQLNVIAALPLLAMIVTVANSRFRSEAIDPLAHREDRKQEIDGRVANNTLEQTFLFLVATLALSTVVDPARVQILIALTIVFVLARIAFWIGYRMHPLYRAPGMAATSYLNLGSLATAIWLSFI